MQEREGSPISFHDLDDGDEEDGDFGFPEQKI
jgi:hypothetical protein